MSDAPNARRASGLAITPLAAIAVGFFLPTVRACGVMERPVHYLGQHPSTVGWLLPPYLAALLLAVASAALFLRASTPARRTLTVGWVAVAMSFVGTSATLVGWLTETRPNLKLVSWCTGMVCVALIALQRAVRVEGWSRWVRLLGANAALTAGNSVWMLIVTAMGDGAWDAVGVGGHLFVWGTIALTTLGVYGVRDPVATPAP